MSTPNAERPNRGGFTVFLTGLSGAGKSATANILKELLEGISPRSVTVLDGDAVRKALASELGFSRRDRDINVHRIGFVASAVTKVGGTCICAAISPYDAARKEARAMIERHGHFVLVHIATPLAICESRDAKGLYAKARKGAITSFTGISDPYEAPDDAEVAIDCSNGEDSGAARLIADHLRNRGYV